VDTTGTVRRAVGAAVATTLLLTAAACGDDPPRDASTASTSAAVTVPATTTTTTTEPVQGRRPFETRPLERTYQRTAGDGSVRDLQTEVWVPAGDGPFPLVAFAHGNGGHPRKFRELFAAWTAAGFAVVAPRFPVSADDARSSLAASVADVPQQDLDLQFVVEQVRAESDDPGSEIAGAVDPDVLALAGLSLGGGTVLQTAYGDCCASLRPRVVVAFSPVPFGTDQGADAAPLVLVHGTDDLTLPYRGSRDLMDRAANRRWFVTLQGAGHADPYEDIPGAHDQLVRDVSIDVFDQFLLGDPAGMQRATDAVTTSGLGTVEAAG